MRRDYLNVAILWLVLTLIVEFLLPGWNIFPNGYAEEATRSDEAFRLLLVLGAPVFTFVVAVMAYSVVKFRAKGDAPELGAPIKGNAWVLSVWLFVTALLNVAVVIHPGLTGLAFFQGNKNPEVVVKVIGRQWAWNVSYPEYGIENVTEIVLPVGRRVKFEVTSSDVLHSFWIPAFRNKIDVVPGKVTSMYITPTEIGSYDEDFNLRAQCAELCGSGHSVMSLPVRVLSQEDFEAWVRQNSVILGDATERGAALAQANGCLACHSVDGKEGVGPTWKGLFGATVTLADGATVTVDEDYLEESIVDPNAKIVEGFQPDVMPKNFGTLLTGEQIHDILAFITSLK